MNSHSSAKPKGRFNKQGKSRFFSRSKSSRKRVDSERIEHARYIKKAEVATEQKPTPIEHRFEDFGFHPQLQNNITQKGYTTPTPIQDQTIPHTLAGKDVIGIANTGTGKTAAFLLPLIHRIYGDRKQKILVIVPTRELANQVAEEFRSFTQNANMFSTVCIGGASIGYQISQLRRRPHCVIATPGRLVDLIERRAIDLRHFSNIVLDEVDRMLDMGFIHSITRIIELLPEQRQSLFFSATFPANIKNLANSFLREPVTVSVRTQPTSANVDQDIIRTQESNKIGVLHDLLQKPEFEKVIVFIGTKHRTEKVTKQLLQKGIKADAIHGDKTQGKRQQALAQFKQNRIRVLVATDVAARGLDIDGVTHVINFDQPKTYDDYIHRIGRTGRGNKKGVALTFVSSHS